MQKKIRIFVVDDHELLRQGVHKIVSRFPDMVVVGEAGSAEEMFDNLRRSRATIVILDIDLPGRSGLEALGTLRKMMPEVRVLILSMFPEEQFAIRCLREGAWGYVSKKAVSQQLVDAIRTIAGGKKYITPEIAGLMTESLLGDVAKPRLQSLSSRELMVLRSIASGKSISEIADQLSLSIYTIATYRRRLLKKLGVTTNAELVRFALKEGIIQ